MSLPERMRALRLHRTAGDHGPADLRVDEVARPDPPPTGVLVEVAACGLSADDRRMLDGTIVDDGGGPLPLVLGREVAGTIAAVGDEVTDWQPGDRVAIVPTQPCHRCAYCAIGRENLCRTGRTIGLDADGGLATYVVADAGALVPVPLQVPTERAAITTGAVATPYHAMKRAGIAEGVTLVVMGLGGSGLHAVLLAKLAGASVIGVDRRPAALARGLEWGADQVVDAGEHDPVAAVHDLTGGGADRAMDLVGAARTVDQTVRCLAPGGRAVLVARGAAAVSTVTIARFVGEELDVVGSAGATAQDIGELFDLLDDGRLDLGRSVSATTDLSGAAAALVDTADDDGVRIVATDLR